MLWQDPTSNLFHTIVPLKKFFHDEETFRIEIFGMVKPALKHALVNYGNNLSEALSKWTRLLEELTPTGFLEELRKTENLNKKGILL